MSWFDERPWTALYNDKAKNAGPLPRSTTLEVFAGAVKEVPDLPALSYFGDQLTYAQVDSLTDGVAGYLRSKGFDRGDRLALFMQNIPQFVIALLGTWKAGGIAIPVNPMYRDELPHLLTDAGARAIVCSESAWADRVERYAEQANVHIALTVSELDLQSLDDDRVLGSSQRIASQTAGDLLTEARRYAGTSVPDPGLTVDDIALISYTSGTSGVPKGATNTHGNLTVNAATGRCLMDLPERPVILAMAPLFHITGMVVQVLMAIDLHGTLALSYRFEPGVVLDSLSRDRPAYMVGPSTAYMALMAHPDFSREHFDSLEVVSSGGAPLPPAIVERFRELTGLYMRNGYGLTETSAPCASVPAGVEAPVDPDSGTLAVGLPLPDALVRIVGDDGSDLQPREVGEIVVEGPMVVPEYWNQPAATRDGLPRGRLRTGDVGFMDAEGWLYVVDRKKDMINASGFKVWPREVEDVLYTHPAVREAAVVGEPDAYRGETVVAFVSPRPGQTIVADDVIGYCKERLAAFKYPRRVEVREDLPKTLTGKILRRELRAEATGPSEHPAAAHPEERA